MNSFRTTMFSSVAASVAVVTFSPMAAAIDRQVVVNGSSLSDPIGVGFGHWEGASPLKITLSAEPCDIATAEMFAPEAVIWLATDFSKPDPWIFETAAILPEQAFAVRFAGTLDCPGKGGSKTPKPPEWAVGVNDVDLDFDSDNNAGPGRHPDESEREDQLEFAEEGAAAGPFGMRLTKEEGWVRLVLKGHAKTDGYLSLQAKNLTDFEFRDAQQNSLSGIAGAKSARVDGATVLFEKEYQAGTRIGPLAFDVRVTDAGATNKRRCLVAGQFQAKKPAAGSDAGHAIDKGLIKVAPDIDFRFTDAMLLDPEAGVSSVRYFIYPCVTLCDGKKFLEYKTGSVGNIQSITFTIKDKSDNVVWEHTDTASADWKEIFPECRANKSGSKDFSGKPYQVGAKWKYLDPGKNGEVPDGALADHGHYPPQSSAYEATMTVSFNGGGADAIRTLNFDVRSRDILIARTDDPDFGAMAEAAVRKVWGGDSKGLDAFASEVSAPNRVLSLAYQRSNFREAFKSLTPRGRLVTVNHGLANFGGRTTIDGRSNFGGIAMEGPHPGDPRPGFGLGTDFEYDGASPVNISDLLEPYGVFVDLAHCYTAHHSGWDDSGVSVSQSFAVAANGGLASAKARGYVGECNLFVPEWQVRAIFTVRDVSRERLSAIRLVAIQNLLNPHLGELGLVNPEPASQGVDYSINGTWAAQGGDYSVVEQKIRQYLAANRLQAEVDRLLAPGEGSMTLDKVSVTLFGGFTKNPKAVKGDDEGAPKTPDGSPPREGEDVDADGEPSSPLDNPDALDDPFPLITVAP